MCLLFHVKRQIDTQHNVVLAYCNEKSIIFTPETISKLELNEILGRFYGTVCGFKKQGLCQLAKKICVRCIKVTLLAQTPQSRYKEKLFF